MVVLTPSPRMPLVIERMSGRTQSASVMRWYVVTIAVVIMAVASAVTTKGMTSVASNDHAMWPMSGQREKRQVGNRCGTCRLP